ncbi:histidine kinase N-terminal 7TM domain-containing diguanylate cyclase [Paenibacillus protaetiae]|uniref:Diguanylate cyclase n=1 Tax=Paenibacillus protaetiae TaxID=2509456 RepID=A0A4V0YF91_9BACL|nr:diguanylate cyclase [Paenibacillus protaetiae]QAY66891.1 diguanylate cyclase [Paenibacillus protaetiae]
MNWKMWLDFSVFIGLLGLFFYMFAFSSITKLHRIYLMLHIIFMIWPFFQFISQTSTPNTEVRLFYLSVAYAGLTLLGVGWLVFTIFLTGQPYIVKRKRLIAFSLPAVLCAAAVIANPEGWFVTRSAETGFLKYGPLYWAMLAEIALYLAVSFVIMAYTFRKALTDPHKKMIRTAANGLAALVLFGAADLIVNGYLLHNISGYKPLLSIGLTVVSLYLVHAMTRQKVFDIIQIAQRDVMNTMPSGILVLDEHDIIVDANMIFRPFYRLRIGDKFDPLAMAERLRVADKRAVVAFFKEQAENPGERLELELCAYLDGLRYLLMQSAPIRNKRKQTIGRLITFQDVTELRLLIEETNTQNELLQERNRELMQIQQELSEANRKLEHMAITDSLTGCFNRRHLLERMEEGLAQSIKTKEPFSIIMLDIDLFKTINDTYGHLVGDEVLCATVEAVRGTLKATDVFARYGGEEFAIYMPGTTKEQAEFVAERMKEAVQNNQLAIDAERLPISVTISIGLISIESREIAFITDHKAFIHVLLNQADSALYEAKFSGRNRIVKRKMA